MDSSRYLQAIRCHYELVWRAKSNPCHWNAGPVNELPDLFSILEFEPTHKRPMWTYATCGMSKPSDQFPLELHIFSPYKTESIIELLTFTAHYHRTGHALNHEHTINFGRPWLPASTCEFGLISLPYLDGPELELLQMEFGVTRFLWLIPITEKERHFKTEFGMSKLEERLEGHKFNYLDPGRQSVI